MRSLTRFLGKLGVKSLMRENSNYADMLKWRASQGMSIYPDPSSKVWDSHPPYTYGLGLKEAKDLIERMYPVKAIKCHE